MYARFKSLTRFKAYETQLSQVLKYFVKEFNQGEHYCIVTINSTS